jgi:hypothetical protein
VQHTIRSCCECEERRYRTVVATRATRRPHKMHRFRGLKPALTRRPVPCCAPAGSFAPPRTPHRPRTHARTHARTFRRMVRRPMVDRLLHVRNNATSFAMLCHSYSASPRTGCIRANVGWRAREKSFPPCSAPPKVGIGAWCERWSSWLLAAPHYRCCLPPVDARGGGYGSTSVVTQR